MPPEDVLDALVQELPQRDVELDDEAYRRGPRRLGRVLLVGLPGRRPVEVIARHPRLFVHPHGPLANAHESQARRRHERLLRAGDDDVDSPLVGPQSTGPRPETASTIVTTFCAALAKPSMSLTVPVEVSRARRLRL